MHVGMVGNPSAVNQALLSIREFTQGRIRTHVMSMKKPAKNQP